MNYYDEEKLYHKSNRDQARSPKSHSRHWCIGCDASEVNCGEVCSNCGTKDISKRSKK